ncbi:AcvB/VirJ family lysyl-phosphatidylglycerol hydrolase [Parapedobacter koreensis]|uniref:Virulence protein (VirJ) n=1 Tax=Parapedobacter koreensis TaxID=332977 RepID=A0A1H7QTG4_9SPHI|nr:AcvB/VirJ family lysyl-phosphatidylglycerol hydrolase [Parapedobacter koreensis]SEL51281.1 virulence protein (VirJ) [Parapedobacter koreensis]
MNIYMMNSRSHHTLFCALCIFLCNAAGARPDMLSKVPPQDLPVMEVKAANESLPLILYLSGDGGYNTFSQRLVAEISSKGYGVLVLDARNYFWKAKTPQQLAADMASLLAGRLQNPRSQQVFVVGYSFGASVIPFMLSRLPSELLAKVGMAVCISPGRFADFEVTLATLLNNSKGNEHYPVVEECRKLKTCPCYFLFGKDEDAGVTRSFIEAGMPVAVLPGSHDYRNDIGALSKKLLEIFHAG